MINLISVLLTLTVFCFSGCSGCSKSGRRNVEKDNQRSRSDIDESQENQNQNHKQSNINTSTTEKLTVKMNKVNGVYEIPTEINGIPMNFIFDTGAGMISISDAEAYFLYKQGKLTKDDIIGNANFIDANGEISEGTIIRLKTVKLGNRVLENIEASVVHNMEAPLLIGQSALEKFVKISIDYQKEEITFE